MKHLTLCVTYTAKAGMRESFVQAVFASGVLEQIRREDGCVAYRIISARRTRIRSFCWRNGAQRSSRAHLNQPHMEILKAIKERYIADTSLERLS